MSSGIDTIVAPVADRLTAAPLLVALDLDGTLAPIASRPDLAVVPEETRAVLRELRDAPQVHVAFVTGRAAADGARIAALQGCWVIGNHGMECQSPDGEVTVDDSVKAWAPAVARAYEAIVRAIGSIDGVVVEDKRWTLSVHYRLAADDEHADIERAVREIAVAEGLVVTRGKLVAEVRPPVEVNKGTAVVALARSLEALDEPGNTFFAGDDHTDEDAIRRLRAADQRAVTVHVGTAVLSDGSPTAAELVVRNTHEMRDLLVAVLDIRKRETPAR